MAHYLITERQVLIVHYHVEADNADMARDHVKALGVDEYDERESVETDIVAVEEITD
jgi:hypothetical protein